MLLAAIKCVPAWCPCILKMCSIDIFVNLQLTGWLKFEWWTVRSQFGGKGERSDLFDIARPSAHGYYAYRHMVDLLQFLSWFQKRFRPATRPGYDDNYHFRSYISSPSGKKWMNSLCESSNRRYRSGRVVAIVVASEWFRQLEISLFTWW